MGGGQIICDPFLGFQRRVFWKDSKPPKLKDGVFATVWALQHAVDVNAGGIKDPIEVAILKNTETSTEARLLDENDDLGEHYSNIAELEKYIGQYQARFGGTANAEVPEVEKPK